jgi:hypothetical protein
MTSTHATRIDAAAVSEDAYVFAYPLVVAELLRIEMTSVPAVEPQTMRAPLNALVHARRRTGTGVMPSTGASMLSTSAWLDLAAEPVVLSVPETHGRYYVMSMIDMWTNPVASVGPRTTGTGPGAFAIGPAGADCSQLPAGVLPIVAPTRYVRIVGQTCIARGEADTDVVAVQRGYGLTPLSRWPAIHETAAAPSTDADAANRPSPAELVEKMDAQRFFGLAGRLVADNPPRTEDRRLMSRAQQIGLFTACDDPWMGGDAALQGAVERGTRRGSAMVRARAASAMGETSNRWHVDYRRGDFETDYLSRAGAARTPLAEHLPADALPAVTSTDDNGRRLTGRHRYVLRFGVEGPPPVDGFWALSTHAVIARSGQVQGTWVSLGDQDGLTVDGDGSLPIHIQHDRPPRRRQSNWLAAPEGHFRLMLRLHWAREEALAGRWTPPAVIRVD